MTPQDWMVVGATVASVLLLGPALYLFTARGTYRNAGFSPETDLSADQLARFERFPAAATLQLATNRASNRAIRAKTLYLVLGIAASSVAPALILVAEIGPVVTAGQLLSPGAINWIEASLIVTLGFLVPLNRRPTDAYCTMRLRAELLRSHLHAYLAGVGPYRDASVDAHALVRHVEGLDARAALEELRNFCDTCLLQSAMSWPAVDMRASDVDTYVDERVMEQGAYFLRTPALLERAYRRSTRLVGLALLFGCIAAVARIWYPDLNRAATAVVAVASALGALVLGLRAVFGWDSRASLYTDQHERLHRLATKIREIQQAARRGVVAAEDAVRFRQLAARYESVMASEACDWAMISDRRYYDASM